MDSCRLLIGVEIKCNDKSLRAHPSYSSDLLPRSRWKLALLFAPVCRSWSDRFAMTVISDSRARPLLGRTDSSQRPLNYLSLSSECARQVWSVEAPVVVMDRPAAPDPFLPAATFSVNDRSTLDLDLRKHRRTMPR